MFKSTNRKTSDEGHIGVIDNSSFGMVETKRAQQMLGMAVTNGEALAGELTGVKNLVDATAKVGRILGCCSHIKYLSRETHQRVWVLLLFNRRLLFRTRKRSR